MRLTRSQVYLTNNDTSNAELLERIEKNGAKAIVFTVDSAAGSIRQRAQRFGVGSAYCPPIILLRRLC